MSVATPQMTTDWEAQEFAKPPLRTRVARTIRFSNIGAIWVWLTIIVLFSVWKPDTFPTWTTVQVVMNQNAITGLAALALIVPLSARVFDLSIGYAMALCSVIVAWLIVDHGMAIAPAIAVGLLVGVAVGFINAAVVVGARIDSFIGTVATGALFLSINSMVSGNNPVTNQRLSTSLGSVATSEIAGFQLPVWIMIVAAMFIWWLLEQTVTGRRISATGFNEESARLVGVPTRRLMVSALVLSGTIAGVAGILLTSQVGSGSPDVGPSYLLDAFACAFLGATQFRRGRFNAAGTIVAVLMLGTGDAGLTLVGAPIWALSLFHGVVLLVALALRRFEGDQVRRGATENRTVEAVPAVSAHG
jgi:ribose transport system permease protein